MAVFFLAAWYAMINMKIDALMLAYSGRCAGLLDHGGCRPQIALEVLSPATCFTSCPRAILWGLHFVRLGLVVRHSQARAVMTPTDRMRPAASTKAVLLPPIGASSVHLGISRRKGQRPLLVGVSSSRGHLEGYSWPG